MTLCGSLLFAQAIDKPLATVRLTKTQAITVKQLRRLVDPVESRTKIALTKEQRLDALNNLISRALIEQAAERDKISISDGDFKTRLDALRNAYGMQLGLGRDLTEQELQAALKNQGYVWDDWLKDQRYLLLAVKYARFKNQPVFDAIKQPTDEEARAYYDANKTKEFVSTDMVHIRWIVVDTRALTSKEERDKAAKQADEVLKEFKAGAKFEDLVVKYSDDSASKYRGGDVSWVLRTNEQSRQYLGDAFMNTVFSMKKGDTSGVISTNQGYIIVQVIDRIDAKILGFEEMIPPLNQGTVKDAIKVSLYNQKMNDTLNKVVTDLAQALRKDAEIKVFEENLTW
jgi:parvulin-like peptidyl-prolyl isomerase